MIRSMLTPSRTGRGKGWDKGCEHWMTDALSDNEPCWWEGWWTPKPIDQWWMIPNEEWRFIGHKYMNKTMVVIEAFTVHPYPNQGRGPPDSHLHWTNGWPIRDFSAVLQEERNPQGKGQPPRFLRAPGATGSRSRSGVGAPGATSSSSHSRVGAPPIGPRGENSLLMGLPVDALDAPSTQSRPTTEEAIVISDDS